MKYGAGADRRAALHCLLPGLNGGNRLDLSEEYGDLFLGAKLMERERVRDIWRTLKRGADPLRHHRRSGDGAITPSSATQDIYVLGVARISTGAAPAPAVLSPRTAVS